MTNLTEKVVGFVGTGVMGRSMAANLMSVSTTAPEKKQKTSSQTARSGKTTPPK